MKIEKMSKVVFLVNYEYKNPSNPGTFMKGHECTVIDTGLFGSDYCPMVLIDSDPSIWVPEAVLGLKKVHGDPVGVKPEGFQTYSFKKRRGIDDLEGMMGDFATEWWTDDDWAKWNAGSAEREARNQAYIAKLKETGKFGEEYEQRIHFIPHPAFQDNTNDLRENWRVSVLDLQI